MVKKTEVNQKTIKKSVTLKGVGLHTGENVTMKFVPAEVNHGFAFKRIDLEGEPVIEADANYVVNTQRGTNLEKNGVKIQAQSGIGRNVKDDEVLQGSPALNYGDYNKSYVHFKNLPKLVNQVSEIEKKIDGEKD